MATSPWSSLLCVYYFCESMYAYGITPPAMSLASGRQPPDNSGIYRKAFTLYLFCPVPPPKESATATLSVLDIRLSPLPWYSYILHCPFISSPSFLPSSSSPGKSPSCTRTGLACPLPTFSLKKNLHFAISVCLLLLLAPSILRGR